MTIKDAGSPVEHAYCGNLSGLHVEQRKARERLSQAFPKRTLIHIHPAGPSACGGKAHELWRLNGEQVQFFTGPPKPEDLVRYA